MDNKKWGVHNTESELCYVVLFVSRKKDNAEIENFEERRKAFICAEDDLDYYKHNFEHFVSDGQVGEMSRMYISVNKRHIPTIRKQLLHFLIDDDSFNLCSIRSKIAGIAAQKECAAEKKWLIDFDSTDIQAVDSYVQDLKERVDADIVECIHQTPHGYAIILKHGFYTEVLSHYWDSVVTIKKDDLLCIAWGTFTEEDTIITYGAIN